MVVVDGWPPGEGEVVQVEAIGHDIAPAKWPDLPQRQVGVPVHRHQQHLSGWRQRPRTPRPAIGDQRTAPRQQPGERADPLS
ncbi:hypothetical protein [Actinomadura macrotermitis]|uniref:hypothetical protein n=1 Tax=Actinomadura macrotermitis TaxID=2585200 RepID=UPI001295C561|nr:hypothetical protein [Actinomadura macrotermitis]